MYAQGNIVNVDLGMPPKEVQGHEQGYERPCIVVKAFPSMHLAIVLPCTSKTPSYSHFTIVRLQKGSGGLAMDSFVLCHQVRTISFGRILKVVGNIGAKDLLKIKAVLIDTLDL